MPWIGDGKWVWSALPDSSQCDVAYLGGSGPRLVREIRSALKCRNQLSGADLVYTWELRCLLAVRLVVARSKTSPKLVAVAPVVKGPWDRHRTATAKLLSSAQRVVWMSEWEKNHFAPKLGLDSWRMLCDRVPGHRSTVVGATPPASREPGLLVALGDSARDWPTLGRVLDSHRGAAHVLSRRPRPASLPERVLWSGPLPPDDSLRILGKAFVHVLPLELAEYACGQSALVRALMEGTPSVVTDLPCLAEYGMPDAVARVSRGDAAAMKEVVQAWMDDDSRWLAASRAAWEFGRNFEHGPFAHRMIAIGEQVLG